MFLTMPEARFPIPQALLAAGASAWSVIRKQMFFPWYIVTFSLFEEGHKLKNTLLVSEPEWLRVALQTKDIAEIHSVQKMEFDFKIETWVSIKILEIWVGYSGTESQHARIAVKEADGSIIYADEWGDEACDEVVVGPHWKMLYKHLAEQEQ